MMGDISVPRYGRYSTNQMYFSQPSPRERHSSCWVYWSQVFLLHLLHDNLAIDLRLLNEIDNFDWLVLRASSYSWGVAFTLLGAFTRFWQYWIWSNIQKPAPKSRPCAILSSKWGILANPYFNFTYSDLVDGQIYQAQVPRSNLLAHNTRCLCHTK